MSPTSMSCYGLGAHDLSCIDGEGAATVPKDVPPDQTNI